MRSVLVGSEAAVAVAAVGTGGCRSKSSRNCPRRLRKIGLVFGEMRDGLP